MYNTLEDLMRDIEKFTRVIPHRLSQCFATEVKTIPLSGIMDLKYQLRDSLSYRMNSIFFHLDVSLRTYFSYSDQVSPENLNQRHLLHQVQNDMMYLFDDIIFNTISLFDYLSRLISVLYLGGHSQLKWNQLFRACSDQSNPLSKFAISPKIITAHKDWVDDLYEYRSDLIHKTNDDTNSSVKFHYAEAQLSHHLFVKIPDRFAKRIKISETGTTDHINIHECIIFVITQSFEQTNLLTNAIREEKYPAVSA